MYEDAITVVRAGAATTFPMEVRRRPSDWDFSGERFWTMLVVPAATPLRLFTPAEDLSRLAFTRIGDNIRQGIFRIVPSRASGEPAFHLELPVLDGRSPDDYTVSLVVKDRIAARGEAISGAKSLRLRLRGLGARQLVHVTLMERDGTSWSTAIAVDSAWTERSIPLAELKPARGVLLPLGYPGTWNYWVPPASGRGGSGDALRLADVERLQLSLRREDGVRVTPGSYGVEVEWVVVGFE
jgi:hypothetical protein